MHPHSQHCEQPPIYQQAKIQTHGLLMVPRRLSSHSRPSTPSTPSNSIVDSNGLKQQTSLPLVHLEGTNLMAPFNRNHASTDITARSIQAGSPLNENIQLAPSTTQPLHNSPRKTAQRLTRDRSKSQPQHGSFLKVTTQEQLKRKSMSNINEMSSNFQPHSQYISGLGATSFGQQRAHGNT